MLGNEFSVDEAFNAKPCAALGFEFFTEVDDDYEALAVHCFNVCLGGVGGETGRGGGHGILPENIADVVERRQVHVDALVAHHS